MLRFSEPLVHSTNHEFVSFSFPSSSTWVGRMILVCRRPFSARKSLKCWFGLELFIPIMFCWSHSFYSWMEAYHAIGERIYSVVRIKAAIYVKAFFNERWQPSWIRICTPDIFLIREPYHATLNELFLCYSAPLNWPTYAQVKWASS